MRWVDLKAEFAVPRGEEENGDWVLALFKVWMSKEGLRGKIKGEVRMGYLWGEGNLDGTRRQRG